MLKHSFISLILSFTICSLFAQVNAPVSVDHTPPTLKTDTIIDGNKIFLSRTFAFGIDTIIIETGYRYTPNDFSFYYQELEEKVVVSYNGTIIQALNRNHLPLVHAYPKVVGQRITANAIDYLILLGNEFYCDGKECNNLFALVLNTSTLELLDINTGFCDAKELLKLINKRSKENDNVQVPVINNCKEDNPSNATWINVDKAL